MREYDAYLFDADGTLLDTREIIRQSFAHTIAAMGRSTRGGILSIPPSASPW